MTHNSWLTKPSTTKNKSIMYFTITTNKEVAELIKQQCERDEKYNSGRSYELGKITHNEGYSVVQIKAKDGKAIKHEDIFWLGHFSAK